MDQQARGCRELVTFRMGRSMFALDVERVHGICCLKSVQPLAAPPALVRGFGRLRDRRLPVVDVRVRYGMQPALITWRSCLVLTEIDAGAEKILIGAIADSAGELVTIDAGAFRPAPRLGAGVPASFVSCVAAVNDELLIVLNLDSALSADDLAATEPVANSRPREVNVRKTDSSNNDGH